MRSVTLGLLLLLPLAACGGDPSTVVAAPTPGASQISPPPGTRPTFTLAGDGLQFTDGDLQRSFGFGPVDVQRLRDDVAAAVGAPTQDQPVTCGQGRRTQISADGFDVLLDGQQLVGWQEAGSRSRLPFTTDKGVTLGTPRQDLEAAYTSVEVRASTLGTEFTTGSGVSGFLGGDGANARVTRLYAGETCFAR